MSSTFELDQDKSKIFTPKTRIEAQKDLVTARRRASLLVTDDRIRKIPNYGKQTTFEQPVDHSQLIKLSTLLEGNRDIGNDDDSKQKQQKQALEQILEADGPIAHDFLRGFNNKQTTIEL